MVIEYRIHCDSGGVTVTQRIEPGNVPGKTEDKGKTSGTTSASPGTTTSLSATAGVSAAPPGASQVELPTTHKGAGSGSPGKKNNPGDKGGGNLEPTDPGGGGQGTCPHTLILVFGPVVINCAASRSDQGGGAVEGTDTGGGGVEGTDTGGGGPGTGDNTTGESRPGTANLEPTGPDGHTNAANPNPYPGGDK